MRDDEPGDPEEGHRVLRDPLDAVDEIVAAARRLGPGDRLAPPLLLALLLLEALLLQLLQALDALDGGRLLVRRAAAPRPRLHRWRPPQRDEPSR